MAMDLAQLRERARRCRELAETTRDSATQKFLLMLAEDYDRDAAAAEGAAAKVRALNLHRDDGDATLSE